jgi:hypothetical protein
MALTLVPTEQVDEAEATRAAWSLIAEAYEKAAKMPGVEAKAHGTFTRCAVKAARLARVSPFTCMDGGDA